MTFRKLSTGKAVFNKVVSIIIIQSFLLSSVSFAAPVPAPTIPATIDATMPTQQDLAASPDKVVISREAGLVKSQFIGKSNKLIIHIQDAHCNFEAQSNIVKILESLIKNYNLKLISVEGADGIIDTSWFKAFPDEEVRKEVATYFMKKGEITGPEFLSITTDYPIKLFGAETRSYYIDNLNAFMASYPLKDKTEKYYSDIKAVLNKLKTHIYSDELKEIDTKMQDYESKKLQFNDYVRFLQAMAEKHKIDIRQYENFYKLANVLVYEKKIDFKVTDKERSALIDELSKSLEKDVLTELVTRSITFKTGKISSAEYYSYLRSLAQKNGMDLANRFPNLYNYIIYNSIYSRIENEKLFKDIQNLEQAVKEKLFLNDDQRTLEELSRHVDILLGLINIKLLNGDYDYYKTHKDEFSYEVFADFIKKKIIQYGFSYDLDQPDDDIAGSTQKLDDFYSIAIKRDNALLDNTLKAMDDQKESICVLITGGFHSEGISKLLEKQDVSYLVVCPSITKDAPSPYIQILTNQRTSFEDILVGAADAPKQGMLAPFSIAEAISLNEKELRKLSKAVEVGELLQKRTLPNGTLEERVLGVRQGWLESHLYHWLTRALAYTREQKIGQERDSIKRAYEIAVDIALAKMVKNKDINGSRVLELRKKITGGDFNRAFNAEWSRAATAAGISGVMTALRSESTKDVAREGDERNGAIRSNGGGLTKEEHRGENGVNETIDELITDENIARGNVYALAKGAPDNKIAGDKDINLGQPKSFDWVHQMDLSQIRINAKSLGVSIIVIKGLKAALIKRGIAPDLIFHPGVGRRAIYLDEGDLEHLLSLNSRVELLMEAVNHEKAHIDKPKLSEEEIEKMATSENVRLAFAKRDMDKISSALKLPGVNREDITLFMAELRDINLWLNYAKPLAVKGSAYEALMVRRSDIAKDLSALLMKNFEGNKGLINKLTDQSMNDMRQHVDRMVEGNKFTAAQGSAVYDKAADFLQQWLGPENNIPAYIRQGVYRAMLEGRYGDILYTYGFGWRQFGTAGIRNQAFQSEFKVLLEKEGNEFAKDPHAPILTGPNLINSVTLLQQVAAIAKLSRDFRVKIAAKLDEGKSVAVAAKELGIAAEFAQNIMDNTITVAYDSRLNGEYFAHLQAAAFLKQGMKVNLFDMPAGVPAGAAAAKGASFFGDLVKGKPFAVVKGSIFGVLISASHSEWEYNGFKAFLGYVISQVDAATKDMLMNTRAEVGYADFDTLLDTGSLRDLNNVFRDNRGNLTWLGGAKPMTEGERDYCGAEFIPFYPIYYEYVSRRSPIPYQHLGDRVNSAIRAVKAKLSILYSAFCGVGALPAANLPGFLREMGYSNVDIVDAQTKVMDGRFPGHIMPDPGVVEGWMSNLYQYLIQVAGKDLSGIEAAVDALNQKEIDAATDPDIDRAGMMLKLPAGVKGNLRSSFIGWMERTLAASRDVTDEQKRKVMSVLNSSLEDKLLLTANDAWTFMDFYKLGIRERHGLLDKNKTYVLLKSHVTSVGPERVAEHFRNKGYNVYAVNTFVGFTELAKKGRDLFNIARASWQINSLMEAGKPIDEKLRELKELNEVLKRNVPYEMAGLPMVDEAIKAIEDKDFTKAKGLLSIIAHMEIVTACEESNGYGELGEYVPESDEAVNAHISEKDGSLALYEFFEIASYGRAVLSKSAYEMYTDMLKAIGSCTTENQFLKYPGVSGVQEKTDAAECFEKILAPLLQKALDQNKAATLFNGKYTVESIAIYRDRKYDVVYNGFPEEGIRLMLKTKTGSRAIVTIRASGTGDSNRVYSWAVGVVPAAGQDIEDYRNNINKEVDELTNDFFGIFGTETGYADLPKEKFYGLLTALKEAGKTGYLGILNKAVDLEIGFTEAESKLYDAVKNHAFSTRKQDFAHMAADKRRAELAKVAKAESENYGAWEEYLASAEAQTYPRQFKIFVNGEVSIEVPNAFVKPWLAGLSGYAALKIMSQGEENAEITSDDQEVTDWIMEKISFVRKNPEAYRSFVSSVGSASVAVPVKNTTAIAAEMANAGVVAEKLHAPLKAVGTDEEKAALRKGFLTGGFRKWVLKLGKWIEKEAGKLFGYDVEEGASIEGSHAIGKEGNQGYYVDETNVIKSGRVLSGKEVVLDTVVGMRDFFSRAESRGKPIKYVIKPGIGGQHTPFQGIASVFEVIDVESGKIVGEYELGKNYEEAINAVREQLGIGWDQIAVIPSSKSGSTDETMIIFSEIFRVLIKHMAEDEGINGEDFARQVLETLHAVNFINGKERDGKDLFKVEENRFGTKSLITLISRRTKINERAVRAIFGKVLRNMFFETIDRPEKSRLAAFIRNSGLNTDLPPESQPGFGAMFDNVGGRWTGDLHMMTFMAFHKFTNAEIEAYWQTRYDGINKVRAGGHIANALGNRITDDNIKKIAFVVPEELFWFGKSIEQNFNESIWQKGYAHLVAVPQSTWEAQRRHYEGRSDSLIINLSDLDIRGESVVKLPSVDIKELAADKTSGKQRLANKLGELFTTFYGMTYTVGNRLIARALAEKGYTAAEIANINLGDLNNPMTKIVQQNLYVRQPYVELGKAILEEKLTTLQAKEQANRGAIKAALEDIQARAGRGELKSNITEITLPPSVATEAELKAVIKQAISLANGDNRTFTPFPYLEGSEMGGKFKEVADALRAVGIRWVKQGTSDQHISYQQVQAQPQAYLPFFISFVPEDALPGRPAVGFAKGYLDNVSPNMVRDYFAEASYEGLVSQRANEAGEEILGAKGIFLRLTDNEQNRAMFVKALVAAVKEIPPVEPTPAPLEAKDEAPAGEKEEKLGGPDAGGTSSVGSAAGRRVPVVRNNGITNSREYSEAITEYGLYENVSKLKNTIETVRFLMGQGELSNNVTVIVAQDTAGMSDPSKLAVRQISQEIEQSLGDSYVGIVGEGPALLAEIEEEIARLAAPGMNRRIALVVSGNNISETGPLAARVKSLSVGAQEGGPISAVLNIDTSEGEMSISNIQDLSLKIGFNLGADIIVDALKIMAEVFVGDAKLSPEGFIEALKNGFLTLKPLKPISLEDAENAHRAQAAVLRSM